MSDTSDTTVHNEQDAVQANRAIWDDWLTHQLGSDHYKDRDHFLATGSSLRSIEREMVGEVAGKSMLHLLCNLGSDTLSWARLGANVTGVDFSATAIEQAQALARQEHLAARFICSDLYDLPEHLDEQFDSIISTYGVLCWMHDLPRWASIISRYLRPGGFFYLVDMHPAANVLQSAKHGENSTCFQITHPYFHQAAPEREAMLIGQEQNIPASLSSWSYGLGEVVSALIAAGLRLDYLHEHPQTFYQRLPELRQDAEGWWRWSTQEQQGAEIPEITLPLLFSLRASK